jgi:ABC-type Mn2+/Zn2+ transport system permease subunit
MSINSIAGMSCNLIAGLLFLIGIILTMKNRGKIKVENIIKIIFLASIAIGVHGLGHSLGNDFTTLLEDEKEPKRV